MGVPLCTFSYDSICLEKYFFFWAQYRASPSCTFWCATSQSLSLKNWTEAHEINFEGLSLQKLLWTRRQHPTLFRDDDPTWLRAPAEGCRKCSDRLLVLVWWGQIQSWGIATTLKLFPMAMNHLIISQVTWLRSEHSKVNYFEIEMGCIGWRRNFRDLLYSVSHITLAKL